MPYTLPHLPPRPPDAHKGTFGTVVVVGGCCSDASRMIGAPALAARAALRAGAGLARLLTPRPILDAAISLIPSATGIALDTDADGHLIPHRTVEELDRQLAQIESKAAALVIGPGLGPGDGPRALTLRAIQTEGLPIVLDADALNALAQIPEPHRDFRASAVLTPHPGEYRTLAAALRIPIDPTDVASRRAAAEALAQKLGAIIVLKGAGTVVSDGQQTWVCEHRTPVLATGGTGDVLAGLIAALAAQFVKIEPGPIALARAKAGKPPPFSLFDAAALAVEAHARAALDWSDRHHTDAGLLALELADLLPPVLRGMRTPPP